MSTINWSEITAKLPTAKTPEERAQRVEMFKQFDPNGNGYLSLAEVDKGLRDVLNIDELFDVKPVIIRAFNKAKQLGNKQGVESRGDDYVEAKEFRMLLVYLANYLRIWEIFSAIDTSGDRRLSKEEFIPATEKLSKWIPEGHNPEELWATLNSDGGSYILFTDFAEWAIDKVLENDNPEA